MRNLTISAGLARTVALVAVAGLAAVSCGKARQDAVVSVETNLDAHALAASADHTAQAGTGKVHLTMSMGTTTAGATADAGNPLAFTVIGDGAYDTAAGLSSMTVDLGSALSGLLSSLPSGSSGNASEMLGALADQKQEIVQHGAVLYLRLPMLSMVDPALADKWIKVDGDQLAAAGGSDPMSTDPLSGASGMGDPSAILDYLKGAGADVATVGHETIGGVDTTHVHATLSMRQALDAAGADRDKVRQSLENMPEGMGASIEDLVLPVDVYVDADNYVRRVAVTYEFGDLPGSSDPTPSRMGLGMLSGTGMTMTADFSDFGQPVTITEPAADQTVGMCDLVGHLPGAMTTQATMPAGMC
jgi:hypothetical protein